MAKDVMKEVEQRLSRSKNPKTREIVQLMRSIRESMEEIRQALEGYTPAKEVQS